MTVVFCPVNLSPGSPFHPEVSVKRKNNETFHEVLNAFNYYNIRDRETGRYAAFYIPIVEVDRFTGHLPTSGTLGTVKQYDYRYIGL